MERERERDFGYSETRSVVMAGVGGQGNILAANVLANALAVSGFDVKTSEVHGMAQRGGSVVSMVRFGSSVASPLVPRGEAELLVTTELLEALRRIYFLSARGVLVASRTRIDPLPVLQGVARYPDDAEERLLELAPESMIVDATAIAESAGNKRAANTALLGVISNILPVPLDDWMETIDRLLPAKVVEVNKEAFLMGRELA